MAAIRGRSSCRPARSPPRRRTRRPTPRAAAARAAHVARRDGARVRRRGGAGRDPGPRAAAAGRPPRSSRSPSRSGSPMGAACWWRACLPAPAIEPDPTGRIRPWPSSIPHRRSWARRRWPRCTSCGWTASQPRSGPRPSAPAPRDPAVDAGGRYAYIRLAGSESSAGSLWVASALETPARGSPLPGGGSRARHPSRRSPARW